jgi:hypothetical protein
MPLTADEAVQVSSVQCKVRTLWHARVQQTTFEEVCEYACVCTHTRDGKVFMIHETQLESCTHKHRQMYVCMQDLCVSGGAFLRGGACVDSPGIVI